MNSDDKDDHLESDDDAFYPADYDDDTIDYELDSDKLLEEESFEPQMMPAWEDEETEEDIPREEPALDADPDYTEGPEIETEPEERWEEDDPPGDEYELSLPLPLGLISVAAIALLLLAAGGYGVIQQRTAMQEEIRQLRADLATSSSNAEVADSRQALRTLASKNKELQGKLERLQLHNKELSESLAALKPQAQEGEPSAAVELARDPSSDKSAAAPEHSAKPEVDSYKPAAVKSSANNTWFVNFGSYTQEPAANSWAARLTSEEGRVVVVSGTKGSTHYFRVRVIDLPNREIAEKIARQLEQTHNLPRLWVGKQ